MPIHGHFRGHICDFHVYNHDQTCCTRSVGAGVGVAVHPCIEHAQWVLLLFVVVAPKHRNEFDVAFDFASMLTYSNDGLIYSYFWAATSVVDQPFVVMAVVVSLTTLGHLLPSKWMHA